MDYKSAVILHFCTFTRQGLVEQLNTLSADHRIIGCFGQMQEYSDHMHIHGQTGLLIIGLQGNDYTLGDSLSLITDKLRVQHPHCRVILMADGKQITLLQDYLCRLENVAAVVDNKATLEQLRPHLHSVLKARPALPRVQDVTRELLTPREHKILSGLLRNKSIPLICRNMEIQRKAVSHYKRSALGKLGLKSLNPLLLNSRSSSC